LATRKILRLFALQKDKYGTKKKNTGPDGEEEKDLSTYLEKFNAHIAHAQDWLRMKSSGSEVSLVDEAEVR
jgi:hypothetical protein